MDSDEKLALLDWLAVQKKAATNDAGYYCEKGKLDMHRAMEIKATAFQSVIDHIINK